MNEQFLQEILSQKKFPFFLRIKIIPGVEKNEVAEKIEPDEWKIRIKAQAEKGKANSELLKFLKKDYKIDAEIISGHTSRIKLIKIINAQNKS